MVSLPETTEALNACFRESETSQLLARGLGRSYGDAAVSSNAGIISTEKLNRILAFDDNTGLLRCEPGLSFREIIEVFLPRGWFPAVTPGTKHVTMGGALAADIHGKNHHKDGSFFNCLKSFRLRDGGGSAHYCSAAENSELFRATAGGMGLTGFVSELEIYLRSVESAYLFVKKIRCPNLSETFKLIEEFDNSFEYSVSWIDCLASGRNLGRSILMLGRHAASEELPQRLSSDSSLRRNKAIPIPFEMPSWLLNRYSIAAFNTLYYSLSAADGEEKISDYESFFYPLDFLSSWNRLYGSKGFVQYQCVLPLESSRSGMEEILALSSRRGMSSFLAVLKKFGAGNGLLSFPVPGYTIALDMPVKTGLFDFIRELDEIVVKYGGRVYLAKDACLSPETFRSMYADLPDWQKIRDSIDPQKRFSSALSERLKI